MQKMFLKINLSILFLSLIISIKAKEEVNEFKSREEFDEFIKDKDISELEEDYELNLGLLDLIGSGNECLVPEDEAVELLKDKYNVDVPKPSENLRFIIGKCNPILMVPGIYATKLYTQVKCKNMAINERSLFKELRIHCGDNICKDEEKEEEEYPLFIAALAKPFTILDWDSNKYSACLAFFMSFYQNEDECPLSESGNKMCRHSPNIKVGYYGGTSSTKDDSECGTSAIRDVLQTGYSLVDKVANRGSAKSYHDMIKKLDSLGYRKGFSMAGVPNDYRRMLGSNNFAREVFRYQIERLYEQTGKPVVIVGHSYGTLATLSNLVDERNKDLLPKIKKFIAIAPPFAGATKLFDVFLHGMEDFNFSFEIFGKKIVITNYDIYGQFIMYKTLGTITELRPLSIIGEIFNDESYSELGEALKERLGLEKECTSGGCTKEIISEKSKKFDKIFKGFFPSLTEDDCSIQNEVNENEEVFTRKCFTEMFDAGTCPTVISKNENFNPTIDEYENYCGKTGKEYYYQDICGKSDKQCLDEVYQFKGPYVYGDTEKDNWFIDRFNNDFSADFKDEKIDLSYFDSKEEVQGQIGAMMKKHSEISKTKNLPAPEVDTDIIYASFHKTQSGFILDENDFTKKGEVFYKGGDETVPNWSSLLTGLKWIYDKQNNGLKNNYKLVEYCSRLSKDSQYSYDPNKEQKFIALGCSCLDDNNNYKSDVKSCTHAALLNDEPVINYVVNVINDPKEVNNVTEEKKLAVKNFDDNINYEGACNQKLFDILDEAK